MVQEAFLFFKLKIVKGKMSANLLTWSFLMFTLVILVPPSLIYTT